MELVFSLLATMAIVSGIMVISSKNPIHSVLFLIMVFCNVAGLLIFIDVDFFAMIFLVVYVGAISVLFLFVVMMLNIKVSEITETSLRYLPIGGLIGIIFLFDVFLIVDQNLLLGSFPKQAFRFAQLSEAPILPLLGGANWTNPLLNISNICSIGEVLYTFYFYYFLVASLILLVAMIGAIVLTMHKTIFIKRQEVVEQNTREFTNVLVRS